MRAMKCPSCGTESNGAFCAQCGTPLKGAKCRECNAALPAGARFCTNCGTSVTGKLAPRSSNMPWIVAALAVLVALSVLLRPAVLGKPDGATEDGRVPINQVQDDAGPSSMASNGSPPPLSGSPRENADRLFNRIMTERESGDTAKARTFLPMAYQAYEMAGDLDADGLYHLSLLQTFGREYAAGRATAERILAQNPDHLLGLSAAASAARGAGDNAAARAFYSRFLNAYAAESQLKYPEYLDHGRMFPSLKEEAEAYVK